MINSKKNNLTLFIGIAIALLFLISIAFFIRPEANLKRIIPTTRRIIPNLKFTAHDGSIRTLGDFKNKWVLLFFGYTLCPDICPNTMFRLKNELSQLGPSAESIQVVFITLDPKRDTIDRLAEFVPFFDPNFIGLRGDQATIDAAVDFFSVTYSTRQQPDSKSGYSVDHTGFTYAITPKGYLIGKYPHPIPKNDITNDFSFLEEKKMMRYLQYFICCSIFLFSIEVDDAWCWPCPPNSPAIGIFVSY